jgi:hypothetical protein
VIHVLDVLAARPGRLAELRELLMRRYLPGAQRRGMRLVAQWSAPGGGPGEEWVLLWGLADVAGWWAMRAQASADPEVAAFWRDAEACLSSRARRMLAPEDAVAPDAPRRRRLGPGKWPGHRATALLTLAPGAGADSGARLEALARALPRCVPACLRSEIGRNLPGTWNGGDLTLDLWFGDAAGAARWLEVEWADRAARRAFDDLLAGLDAVHYSPLEGGLDAPRIASPVKRTLLLRVEQGAPPDRVAAFERELAAMPDHIPAIRNWHFARVAGTCGAGGGPSPSGPSKRSAQRAGAPVELGHAERSSSGWSHIWAQEFETLDGLQRDYMVHPYHWAVVDRWFDPESPERVVAPGFAHVFCAMPQSVLG